MKKIGSVAPIPLPIQCVMENFNPGSKVTFAVQAKDATGRTGPFSDTKTIYV